MRELWLRLLWSRTYYSRHLRSTCTALSCGIAVAAVLPLTVGILRMVATHAARTHHQESGLLQFAPHHPLLILGIGVIVLGMSMVSAYAALWWGCLFPMEASIQAEFSTCRAVARRGCLEALQRELLHPSYYQSVQDTVAVLQRYPFLWRYYWQNSGGRRTEVFAAVLLDPRLDPVRDAALRILRRQAPEAGQLVGALRRSVLN